MEETERLEQLYTGTADREAADQAERLGLGRYQSWRAERVAISALFGLVAFEFLAF